MMTLVLDTSTDFLLMALLNGPSILAYRFEKLEKQHAEQMLPTLETLLYESKCPITDIQDVLVSIGPGSFTGVRLALTFIKTLALTLPLKIYTLPSLAFLVHEDTRIFATMDARANREYVAAYDGYQTILKPTIMTREEKQNWIAAHPDFLSRSLADVTETIHAVLASVYAWKNHLKPVETPHVIVPLYLKDLQ